jgi:N-acyl-D-amino-acid deacylase
MFDYVIRKALVLDGSGEPAYEADVAIANGRIAEVGIVEGDAARVIDGTDLVLAPGFIDMHSHTDAGLFVDPRAESKITQGVTLEVCGNCGFSSAPVLDEPGRAELESWRKRYDIKEDWSTMDEFLTAFEKRPIGVNFLTLVGHCNLRAAAVGLADREATPQELAQMRRLAAEAMQDGAFGISTGLIYAPGCFGDEAELIEVTKGVAPYGGIYASHIRDERANLVEAVDEAITIGRGAGVPVEIAHHKACGAANWGKVKDTLKLIDKARGEGIDVTADQYPYTASATSLSTLLPMELNDGGDKALLERIKSQREELLDFLNKSSSRGEFGSTGDWANVLISGVRTDKNGYCEGMTIEEIAAQRGSAGAETVLDLLVEEETNVSMVQFGMCEDDIKTVMRSMNTMIGSDASARAITGELAKGKPHPRAFGTFARVLGYYVREQNVIPLETAIRKMTSMPARKLGLADRGTIKAGYWADIVVFDADKVKDMATYKTPHQNSVGIEYVFVNGKLAVEHGEMTGELAGKVLRRGRD